MRPDVEDGPRCGRWTYGTGFVTLRGAEPVAAQPRTSGGANTLADLGQSLLDDLFVVKHVESRGWPQAGAQQRGFVGRQPLAPAIQVTLSGLTEFFVAGTPSTAELPCFLSRCERRCAWLPQPKRTFS